jgi:hypothetical protein
MGLAQRDGVETRHQTSLVAKAETYVDRAADCECTPNDEFTSTKKKK